MEKSTNLNTHDFNGNPYGVNPNDSYASNKTNGMFPETTSTPCEEYKPFSYTPSESLTEQVWNLHEVSKSTPELKFEDGDDIIIYGDEKQKIELYKDWAAFIGEIQNPENNAVNPFFKNANGKGSPYAPLDEVLNTARPVLSKYGFGLFQSPKYKSGQASVKTILVHKSGCAINFPTFTIPIQKNDAQGVIAGVTYARRGVLNPILCTHGETDDDGNSCSGKEPKKESKQETKAEAPKDETSSEAITARKKVIEIAKQLIADGVDRAEVNKTIESVCNVRNINSVNDVKLLNATVAALNEMKKN